MSNLIKNTLLASAIVALGVNIFVVLTHPPRQIEARRPEASKQPTYRAALTRQIHIAYGVELSRLHRELPNLLALQLRIDGLEKALDELKTKYGPNDNWIEESIELQVMLQQAVDALEEGKGIHRQVKGFIRELTTFGTTRFYKDELDPSTLDRTYRGTLTTKELEAVAEDLSTLIATFHTRTIEREYHATKATP
jgi:hypothetical protein